MTAATCWHVAGASMRANHVRLEYDHRATPPLVALQRIKNHAFVSGKVTI